jgi:hypothetical protein
VAAEPARERRFSERSLSLGDNHRDLLTTLARFATAPDSTAGNTDRTA